MLRQLRRKEKPKRGPTKYPGIIRDAMELDVTQSHLWRVLQGERHSPGLLDRYRGLKE